MAGRADVARRLFATDVLLARHIGPDPRQIGNMLGTLGLATLEAFIERAVPAAIRITERLALSEAKSERETVSYLRRMRDRNRPLPQLQ